MKCRTCKISMTVERREADDHAATEWHVCPNCRQVRMTSEPNAPAMAMLATASADLPDDELMNSSDDHSLNHPYAIR